MKNHRNLIKTVILSGIVALGVSIGTSLPVSAYVNPSCDGSCQTEPWGPGGEDITFCDFTYPGGTCSGNTGHACGGCP